MTGVRIFVFFGFVFGIFSLLGIYVYTRLGQTFPSSFVTTKWGLTIFIFFLFSFFIGKIWERASINIFNESLIRIGSVAAGFFFYTLLFIVFFDLIRLINSIIPFYPDFVINNYQQTKWIIGICSIAIISTLMIMGYVKTINPKIKYLELEIDKPKSNLKELNIVAVSDIHLGTMVNKSKVRRLVKQINKLEADVVLIGGDIIDDNIEVVKHYRLMEELSKIQSKYGVYSCMGNHDYISGGHHHLEYYKQNGIHILKDTSILINNQFYVVGRDDIQGNQANGVNRQALGSLFSNIDFSKVVLCLDHQPYKLEEVANYPIDFQFSGHTHNGQFWPLNYITGLIFEEDWGYLKKKNTHFYISSGYGTAVVPIRVGNHSEIVNIKLKNNK
jgi:predicted MPP superfamily phosphohydrolase